MRRLFPVMLAAGALAAAAAPAGAQERTHRETIVAQLDAFAQARAAQGFSVDRRVFDGEALIGLLPNGGQVVLEINLRAGAEYTVAAGCDADCDDLDLRAFSPDGETTLDEDVEGDDVPVVTFTAVSSGPHLLAVMMPGCNTSLCYFGFRVMSK